MDVRWRDGSKALAWLSDASVAAETTGATRRYTPHSHGPLDAEAKGGEPAGRSYYISIFLSDRLAGVRGWVL